MRFSRFSDVATYFKTVMAKKRNTEYHTMFILFNILRIIKKRKSLIKKFPNIFINHCMWIRICNKGVLNFSKLIMKINLRRADIKAQKTRILIRLTLYLVGPSVENSVYKPVNVVFL